MKYLTFKQKYTVHIYAIIYSSNNIEIIYLFIIMLLNFNFLKYIKIYTIIIKVII